MSRYFARVCVSFFSACEQCINESAPRKRQISAQGPWALSVFLTFLHSAQTEKAPENDKIAHSEWGQGRFFLSGFFVNTSGFRGVWVIYHYFIIFFGGTAGASSGLASGVPREHAIEEARETPSGG